MNDERTVRYSASEIREMTARNEAKSDWARVDAATDADADAILSSDADWEGAGSDWSQAVAVYPGPKQAVSIRIDRDVLDFFRAQGAGYQTRINSALRRFMQEEMRRKPD